MGNNTSNHKSHSLTYLAVGSVGVVYGDIGTSPLYTLKECFSHSFYPVAENTILGVLSLIFWSILLIVTLKYAWLILRADNNGEGGILALTTLALRRQNSASCRLILYLGLIGAALFFGDGIITPAISVLSALEGVSVASPQFSDLVIPMSIGVLYALFFAQKEGTGRIGNFFGPIMIVWFTVIGILGIIQILKVPSVLKAINPWYAYQFFQQYGFGAFSSLGSIVLAVTGAEALYADMGHFGRPAIVRAWYVLVLPALLLNYFGQSALLLENPLSVAHPFYHLVPSWGLYPMIILATAATVIASQAVISGVFSMVWQGIQLGYLPRMRVIHTSFQHIGQVFIPAMNLFLLLMTVLLVLLFKSSSNLAEAYGFAVTGIMVITSCLTMIVAYNSWNWSLKKIAFFFSIFILIDLTYFLTNAMKIMDGGWLPILVAFCVFSIMTTWITGRKVLSDQMHRSGSTIKSFIKNIEEKPPVRIPGIAVYMTGTPNTIPNALTINFRHNHVLHEKVILLSLITADIPRMPRSDKILVKDLGFNVYQVIGNYGFKEIPNISYVLEKCDEYGVPILASEISFFLSRGIPIMAMRPYMRRWREHLFIFMARNAMNATEFFKIPHNRVVELGIRFKI